jgi:hypothetical protein
MASAREFVSMADVYREVEEPDSDGDRGKNFFLGRLNREELSSRD